jgi:hypothetical protein
MLALEEALYVYPGYAPARRLLAELAADADATASQAALVYDDLLEIFGETSTVRFADGSTGAAK